MTDENIRIQTAIQKLTEAIWNLDRITPLSGVLRVEYKRIHTARENLMRQLKKTGR